MCAPANEIMIDNYKIPLLQSNHDIIAFKF